MGTGPRAAKCEYRETATSRCVAEIRDISRPSTEIIYFLGMELGAIVPIQYILHVSHKMITFRAFNIVEITADCVFDTRLLHVLMIYVPEYYLQNHFAA